MKSSDNGTVSPRDGAETEHLAHLGGLAGTFFRLARERFSGVLYAETKNDGGVFSIREGRAVFFEDLREGRSVPDLLLELGLITKRQYADIAAEVVSTASDSEDAAFCQQAVALGIVTQEQIDSELARRVRQRFVQASAWEECRVELDPDPDSLTGILEYPHPLAPLAYTGVRTFFDEDRIEPIVPKRGERFVRLLCSEREAAACFELDETEAELLAKLRPDVDLTTVIAQSGSDPLEVRQLVCALVLAQLAEVGSVASSPRPRGERRQERSGEHRTGPLGRYFAGGSVREERVRTGPLSRPVTPPPGPRPPSAPALDRGAARRSEQRLPAATEERVGPLHPLLRDPLPEAAGAPSNRSATRQLTGPATPAASSPARQPERESPGRAGEPAHRRSGGMAAVQVATSQTDLTAAQPPAPGQVAQPREMRRPRTLGAALQRLDRELRKRPAASPTMAPPRPAAASPAAMPSVAPPHASAAQPRAGGATPTMAPPASGVNPTSAAAGTGSGRTHLENLMRMRRAAIDQKKAQVAEQDAGAKAGQDAFRAAQDALRLQKFPRAHELFTKACAAEPGNAMFVLYCQYAAFRANLLSEEELTSLRLALRDKVADQQLRGFAYFALGHIALHEKKDDVAEKCFLKATELDKENKDAERHLRILELRRKHAEQEKSGSLFGKR